MTKLNDLYDNFGQSPWIDNIRRDWLLDGTLAEYVAKGVRGVTSNPSIFAKTLSTSSAYDELIAGSGATDAESLFESLAVEDVRDACDVLRPVYDASAADVASGARHYRDGFVSLEVSPRLAHDTEGTIAAAARLWERVGRPNAMIKIPATIEGLPAIRATLAAGINVNVTLIFSLARYDAVITAWAQGLSDAKEAGRDVSTIASVASFFVSRVDVAVDALLPEGDPRRGTAANAQAAAAYGLFVRRIHDAAILDLFRSGAQVQRPLWASTSTKNPTYPDLLYVDYLVARDTVNTLPDATLAAALERVDPSRSYLKDAESTYGEAAKLDALVPEVDLDEVTDRLEREGVAAFAHSYDELIATVAAKLS